MLGVLARDLDEGDKRALEIRLTQRGIALTKDTLHVVTKTHTYQAEKLGTVLLDELELNLRHALVKLELAYLPESRVDLEQ